MTKIQEKLIEAYAHEMCIAVSSFEFMGRLLDFEYIKRRIEVLELSETFVYGGGYLGIQLFHSVSKFIKVPAVVDRKGELVINRPEIPVINLKKFKKVYEGQKVIIASVKFYCEIRSELYSFIPENQLMFLGEFLGGI